MSLSSVYIHIPFCKTHCPYCDFAVYLDHKKQFIQNYINALSLEISERACGEKVKSIYFGGGTPSILETEQLSQILNTLKNSFDIQKKAEITIEVNPNTLSEQKLYEIRSLGFNRLSVGIQTFEKILLQKLGRIHTVQDSFDTINWAKKVGFNNISIDLIYGLPKQTIQQWNNTINLAMELPIKHISCYSLTIEKNTPFEKIYSSPSNKICLPEEDLICDMYEMLRDKLYKNDFIHYEISNFAKRGYESKHNWAYWTMKNYYGFGLSSYEFINKIRKAHTKDLQKYLNNPTHMEILETEPETEELMLKLRTRKGLNVKLYNQKYKLNIIQNNKQILQKLIEKKLIQINKNKLKITPKGFFISNLIISKLLSF